MSKQLNVNKNTLSDLYIKQGLSARQIAQKLNCWDTTILGHLRRFKIPIRRSKLPLNPNKSLLQYLYINKKLSPYSIAPILKCNPSTVRNWLIAYNFPIRKKNLIKISRKRLLYLYHDKRMSLSEVGRYLSCTPSGILKFFRKYKISTRNASESSKYFLYRRDFSNDKKLMAYMIGFRLGDLHVRQDGHVIRVGGGTTKSNQVRLFKNLFNDYGRVYLGNQDKKGAWHPEVNLNESFSFLLPKHERVPFWIRKSKVLFLNFLAGYTDAEGNIGCYPRGRFKITSYDYGILKDIGTCMRKFLNISPIYFLEKTKRITHKKDALSLILNKKEELYKVLLLLKPLLKHVKRSEDLLKTLNNVKTRLGKNHAK